MVHHYTISGDANGLAVITVHTNLAILETLLMHCWYFHTLVSAITYTQDY